MCTIRDACGYMTGMSKNESCVPHWQRACKLQFAIENKLPSVYTFREHIEAGGLIAYTPSYHDLLRRARAMWTRS
jgi:hypothetical protein